MDERQEILVAETPGWALKVGLKETWTNPNPGWMQYDDGIEVDPETQLVVAIGGEPLDDNRIYRVGTVVDFFRPRDGPTIGNYFTEDASRQPDLDSGIPCHTLLLQIFADRAWERIFTAIDTDGNGIIDTKGLNLELPVPHAVDFYL